MNIRCGQRFAKKVSLIYYSFKEINLVMISLDPKKNKEVKQSINIEELVTKVK